MTLKMKLINKIARIRRSVRKRKPWKRRNLKLCVKKWMTKLTHSWPL